VIEWRRNMHPGFGPVECDPIRADSVRRVVTWAGRSDVSRLAGRPVRLRFEMQNAGIFAFQFIPAMESVD